MVMVVVVVSVFLSECLTMLIEKSMTAVELSLRFLFHQLKTSDLYNMPLMMA